MNYFPAFFNLASQKVLIVGGGEVALRKLTLLERAGAQVDGGGSRRRAGT